MSAPVQKLIGTYTSGQWLPVTLDLNERGVLRVNAPGLSASYTTPNPLATFKFIVAAADSADGLQVRNLALGASANILTTTAAETYFGVNIQDGIPGQTYKILSATSLTPPVTWTSNFVFTQTAEGFLWIDTSSPANKPRKFYTVVPQP